MRLAYEGDTLEFRTFDGSIVELAVEKTLPPEAALISSDLILVSEGDFRRISGVPAGYATDIAVRVNNPRERPMVAMKVAGLFPDTRQISREDILRTYDSLFDWRGGTMSVILLGSLLAFIILAWEKASGLSAEDRKEIGILKAVGWETSDVLFMKFWERIALSLMSFFAGITPGVFPRFLCIIVHSRTGHERLGRSLSPF